MRKPGKFLSLASALAALAAPPVAHAVGTDGAQPFTETEEDETQAQAETKIQVGTELMSFTVHQISDSLMFPQHSSHSSHASHASHASSSPGFGVPDAPSLPYVPNLPSAPYVPNPVYAPPVAAPPVVPPPAQTTTPPAGYVSDPRYIACTGASTGVGVKDIASELEQTFGMAVNDAVNMATQALTAVLAGGHYCDGYLGGHE
jgi:hypothetical protein